MSTLLLPVVFAAGAAGLLGAPVPADEVGLAERVQAAPPTGMQISAGVRTPAPPAAPGPGDFLSM